MSLELELIWYVVICGAILASSLYSGGGWSGLTVAYLLSLGFIYFWGGLIHVLPWYHGGDTDFTELGFRQFTWAVSAFAVGCCLVAPFVRSFVSRPRLLIENTAVAPAALIAGFLLYSLRPLLANIPSFGALASCGGALFVAAICLYVADALRKLQYTRLLLILGGLTLLPLFTIVSQGFLGFGAGAALVVICFLCCVARRPWLATFGLIVTVYFGISIFVTYMRDRDDIRYQVWEEDSSFGERMTRMQDTFTKIDFLDLTSDDQVKRIEDRLNQSDLVGRAVTFLDIGGVEFARGQTFREAFSAMVPRILWPDKAVVAGSGDIVSYFTNVAFAEGTAIGIGQVMEGYINFGTVGVVVLHLIFGAFIGVLDWLAASRLRAGDKLGFITWFVPGMALLQPQGSLVDIGCTVAASMVLIWLFRMAFKARALRAGNRAALATAQ